jgi:UDP-N-acetylbacillosamine transaminase
MIYLSSPHMSGLELEYVKKAFESNYIAPIGEFIDKFEEKIQNYVKAKALALINGTSAIHLALRVLGVSDSKVAVSTFTFIGSVNPILYERNEPVFIDSDKSWQMDLNLLEEALKKEKIKAVVVVHIYGQSAKIREIKYLCDKYGAFLIEDAAEALGAEYEGKKLGTFGDFGVYSFNGNKLLTTGGGGALVSNNDSLIKKARKLSTQAREDFPWYEHKEMGFNYRISNVLAAIGVAQMEVVEERIKRRREIFEIYKNNLDLGEFQPEIPNSKGNRWLSCIEFDELNPLDVMKKLAKEEIETRPLFKPMHMQPLFKNSKAYLNGVSERLFKKGLCLPSGSNMKDEDVLKVINAIKAN